ncbi:MAG TPA: glycosyltransferase family 87 protein [Terriglobales bacterium]|nr:glycosyltransferase family 87 protein [Terriglobales bacterium]
MRIAKKAVTVLALAAAGVITAVAFRYVPLHDFVEYWTAAHVFMRHQDPYSVEALMKLQQAMGWSEAQPLMVMSPPHFLPFLLPLGFMHSYALARLLWLCLSIAMLVFEVFILWRLYGGDDDHRWISICVAGVFFPVWHCLAVAQIGPLLLLGIVGFLWLERRGHLFMAGSALALTTFKPHLFYLLWLALLLWSVKRREMRVIAGASVTICIALTAALLVDPAALSQYMALIRSDYVWEYSSGAGGVLRSLFARSLLARSLFASHSHLLQLAPMLPGVLALGWYWNKHSGQWQWRDRLPAVLTLSVLTAAYGWPFDEVVLLVPVLMIAVQSLYAPRERSTFTFWLAGMFFASLAVVLRYGDAGGMTVCAGGVLAYLVVDSVTARKNESSTPACDSSLAL